MEVFLKKDPLRANFQNNIPKERTISQNHVLWANFVKFGRPEVGKVVRYLPDKKQKFGSRLRSRFCADRAQNLLGPAPNNILGVPQISSKSVHFRRSYSRTREHRSNNNVGNKATSTHITARGSAITEGPRDALCRLCRLKSCQLLNGARKIAIKGHE